MKTAWYPTAFSHWGDEERAAIERVMMSGRFTMGEEVAAFEVELAAYHGRRHAVMVNSGSSANLVAVAALFNLAEKPLKRGDAVLVPAVAWSTTYAPLVQHGLELRLVDIDGTWNGDPYGPRLELDGVRLVVGCSILGTPAQLEAWRTVAHVSGAYMLEDNCESLGASLNGVKCGAFGLMSTASFFWSHQVSAIEGGAVLTDDDECAELCRMLRAHGWSRDVTPPAAFDEEYDFRLFGYNLRPLELHAAVAREQLKKLGGFIEARRANVGRFWQAVTGMQIHRPEGNGFESPFSIHFKVSTQDRRAGAVKALREAGIDCRLPTGGSFTQHAYGKPWRNQATPQADELHCCGLFIGNAPYATDDRVDRAAVVLREVLA